MKIRLAQDKDYAKIARLHRSTIKHTNSKDYPKDVITVWAKRTKADRFRNSALKVKRWVAEENGKIIAFCDHGFDCELGGLYVHNDFQDRGIGKKLLKVAEQSMKKSGCKKINIVSTITAKIFYEKNGYNIIKKGFHNIENKRVSIFHMSKKID